MLQYFLSGASEGRFANATFKGFEEKGEAWIVDSDISNDEFNNLKNVAKETGGDGSIPFWIRLFADGVKYAVTFQIVGDTLEAASSLQELIQGSSEETQVYVFPENEQLTEGNDGNITTFPAGEFTVPTGTPAFDLGEPIGFDDNTFFPKGDGFLDDILNGRFEFPDEGEGGSYFLAIEGEDSLNSTGVTVIGTPDFPEELSQATRLAQLEGGGTIRFLGKNSQGIEGYFISSGGTEEQPFSLKNFSKTGKWSNIVRRINKNANQITKIGITDPVLLRVEVGQFSAEEVENFVNEGKVKNFPSEGVFEKIYFDASDGTVVVDSTGTSIQ